MANYEIAYKKIIGAKDSIEGGYAFIKGDKGLETYMGVSRKYWPRWEGWKTIDAYKKDKGKIPHKFRIPDADLELLVKDFYRDEFWNKIMGDKINGQVIAENFFDMHVNSGSAVKIMQDTLNKLGFHLNPDNKMGPITLLALNAVDPEILNTYYLQARKIHYDNLVEEDPTQKKFYKGWMNRLKHFLV